MAPAPITDDYYMILDVEQSASSEAITKSYKRLALLRHPDRNTRHDTTEAFQLLGKAYETMKDQSRRRAYDLIYPRLKRTNQSAPREPPPQPSRPKPTASTSKQGDTNDATRIAAIEKSKQERASKWAKTRKIYDDVIFELNRDIRKLQIAIRDIDNIDKAEAAEEAAAKSWSAWILSPLYKKPAETEEEKERKARERIQRLHTRTFKEKDLGEKIAGLKAREDLLKQNREEFEASNRRDDRAKDETEERIRLRRLRERVERDRVEREARDKARREQMRQERKREEKARAEREIREKLERERRMKEYAEQRRKEEAEEGGSRGSSKSETRRTITEGKLGEA